MNAANPFGKIRARDSIATNCPEVGWRYNRRSVAFTSASATASPVSRQANAAGMGP